MHKLYSQQGSEAFNQHLHQILQNFSREIAQAVGSNFSALILGGGYGKGEGACVGQDGKETLYNDLDFFLILERPGPLPESVQPIRHRYEEELGIEVDIGRPLTLADIRNLPHQLMWQDLLNGHVVTAGDPRILIDHAPQQLREPLPASESLRLMLNRGSGLLQAIIEADQLIKNPAYTLPDYDFIRRNAEKCMLALGDSILIAYSAYPTPMDRRLQVLKEFEEIAGYADITVAADLYEEAISFKLHPDSLPPDQPGLEKLTAIAAVWVSLLLHLEAKRTGRSWRDSSAYAADTFIREPDQHKGKKLLRNGIKNLKLGTVSFRYPRERLYRDLVRLFGELTQPADSGKAGLNSKTNDLAKTKAPNKTNARGKTSDPGKANALGKTADLGRAGASSLDSPHWQQAAAAFLKLWRQYN
jgi:hypothetical protein